jgi:glycosyltransferase involved in cell wall biosynthesis
MQSIFLKSKEKNTLERADVIATVSRSVLNEVEKYGIKNKYIKVVGNGVDENIFYPEKKKRYKDKYILYTGRLSERKGISDLIESMYQINQKHPKVKLLISGRGVLRQKLEKTVTELELDDVIKFLGYVSFEYLQLLYRNAYLHVIPSYYEGLPTVLLEAMSSGVPVICTAVGGAPDVINDARDGFLINPGEPHEISRIANLLLSDINLRNKIGNNARKKILSRYTWDKIADDVINDYNRITS